MPYARAGATTSASTVAAPGLAAGALRFRLKNIATDATVLGPTATGVAESTDTDGFYIAQFTAPAAAGVYARGWDAAGEVWWDEEDLVVTPTGNPPLLGVLTIDELKLYLNNETRPGSDELLELMLDEAIDLACLYTRRQLRALQQDGDPAGTVLVQLAGAATGAATDPSLPVPVLERTDRFLRVPDAREVTAITVDGTAVTQGAWVLRAHPSTLAGAPAPWVVLSTPVTGEQAVVTGRFGWDALPSGVKGAIYVLAARNFLEKGAAFADIVQFGDDGGAVANYFRQLPPRVKLAFDHIRLQTVPGTRPSLLA